MQNLKWSKNTVKNEADCLVTFCLSFQGINVLEQDKLDNMMIEMDGTENKCKPQSHLMWRDGIYVQ